MSGFPVPKNEEERLEALKSYQILDSLSEAEFDRLTELASLICDVPISLVSLIDRDRQWFKSAVGIDLTETARDVAFCNHTIAGDGLMEVEDATMDARFKGNVFVTGDPKIRFYAGFPLIDAKGYALGSLCVIDTVPRKLTTNQKRSLELLADEVMSLIVERRKKQELVNFEQIFRFSNDLIGIIGPDGFYRKINPSFKTILGWDEAYFLKTPISEQINPEDVGLVQNQFEKLKTGEGIINYSQRTVTRAGAYRDIQWVATGEPLTGNIFVIGRDVTEEKIKERKLKYNEQNLRSYFENTQGLMCTHDLEGNFIKVNNAGAHMLGYTPAEVVKKSLFDLVPAKGHDYLRAYLKEVVEKGESKGQMVTIHKDGSKRIWLYNNVLTKNEKGEQYVIGNSIDITERFQLERELNRTKELLEQTSQLARIGGWELDNIDQKVTWSAMTREIHEAAGDYVVDLEKGIHFYKEGESRDKIAGAVTSAINEGIPFDVEVQIVTAKGRHIWVRVIGNPEMRDGVCIKVQGTFQDIDEKKRAQIATDNSTKLLNDVLKSASEVSIIATDVNGIITVFNTGAEKLLGYSSKEVIGKQSPVLFHSEKEVRDRGAELSRQFGIPVEGFRVFVHNPELYESEKREWTYIRKDGSQFTVVLTVTTIRDYKNNIIGYLGIATDISKRKIAEKELFLEKSRLLAFVEHAPAAVAMFDTEVKYVAASHRWMEEYGIQDQAILGRSHYEIFPNISPEWKEIHQRCLNGAIERREEDIWRPEGWDHDQYLKWEVRPWYTFGGTVGGIMMFTQDITEACQQRDELKAAKLQAEQASIAKSEFLANMSHEIRTPLNGVIGFTDLVLKTNLNTTQHQYITIVNQSANALLSIINDILDFSKIEAGKLELDIERCDLYEIGSQAADIITYQVQSKGLEMLLNVPTNLPRFIWADSVRLKQVLINLLGNAVKFTEYGEIELKIITLTDPDQEQVKFRFEVRDTGIGIKPEKQSIIFEAFSQADGSTTKKFGGTGLGLTISNKLLGLMGSKLKLKSTPGAGSTFYFDISLKTEKGDPVNWDNIEHIKKVLIVDDNDNNRMILNRMMQLKNITAVEAKNGIEALQLLTQGEQFDVVLMDYHMPYMDGLETIRKIRGIFNDQPDQLPIVLLYSSSDDEKVIKACEELKVSHRLVKPIKMQDMFNSLSRLHKKVNGGAVKAATEIADQNRDIIKVLIAEDNSVNMLLARTIVKRITPNAIFTEAKNGTEALRYCGHAEFDIIFMDVQMPDMNGYEATAEIRKLGDYAEVPIIALTAGNVKGEREKCLACGMNDFLAKPVIESDIQHIFSKWLVKEDVVNVDVKKESKISVSHFNVEKIKELVGDEPEIINDILLLTRKEIIDIADELKVIGNNADLKALNTLGHKLYGLTLVSGLDVLTGLARELELLSAWDDAKVQDMLLQVAEEIICVVESIDNEMSKVTG